MKFNTTDITTFEDFMIGNSESRAKGTGCTVIICAGGAVGGVDVRGGAPATRETDLLRSENTVESINAVVLSGGSVFGLEAASGVTRELSERGIGTEFRGSTIPIVCGASLFDLEVGDPKAFPDVEMGTDAVRNAFSGNFRNGNFGAGTGCSVGKARGISRAMKTGVGTFACSDGSLEVGALVAVNAAGDIYNGAGNIVAGLRSEDGSRIFGTIRAYKSMVRGDQHDNPMEDTIVIDTRSVAEAQSRIEHKEKMTEIAEAIREELRRTGRISRSDMPEDLYKAAEVSEARHAAVERPETAEASGAEERMMEEPSGRHMRRVEADHEDQAVRHMRSGEAAPEVSDAIPTHSYANEEIREESVREVPPAAAEETGSTDGYAAEETDLGYDIAFNTTIGCLITNARLSKVQANKLASILHDAYARAVKPVHSTIDGDTIFVLASGRYEVNFDAFAALATDVMQYAVIDGAASAKSAYGLPSARDLHERR